MTCTCGRVMIGSEAVGRNWNPDCDEHGLASEWYNTPSVVARREQVRQRTIDLQRQAREARNAVSEL